MAFLSALVATVVASALLAGVLTVALFLPFVGRRAWSLLIPSAIVFIGGCFLWFVATYFTVVPFLFAVGDERRYLALIPPLALSLIYGGWAAARIRSTDAGRRVDPIRARRALRQFGIGVAIAVATVMVMAEMHGGTGRHNDLPAAVAVSIMLMGSWAMYLRDRDVEQLALMTGLAVVATVPVVIVGRALVVMLG